MKRQKSTFIQDQYCKLHIRQETTEAHGHNRQLLWSLPLSSHGCNSHEIRSVDFMGVDLVGVNHSSHLFQQKLRQLIQVLQVFDHLLPGHSHVAAWLNLCLTRGCPLLTVPVNHYITVWRGWSQSINQPINQPINQSINQSSMEEILTLCKNRESAH